MSSLSALRHFSARPFQNQHIFGLRNALLDLFPALIQCIPLFMRVLLTVCLHTASADQDSSILENIKRLQFNGSAHHPFLNSLIKLAALSLKDNQETKRKVCSNKKIYCFACVRLKFNEIRITHFHHFIIHLVATKRIVFVRHWGRGFKAQRRIVLSQIQ